MEKITAYKTVEGRVFEEENKAHDHEVDLEQVKRLNIASRMFDTLLTEECGCYDCGTESTVADYVTGSEIINIILDADVEELKALRELILLERGKI